MNEWLIVVELRPRPFIDHEIVKARRPQHSEVGFQPFQKGFIAAPDIVIEILSPGRENISRDRIAKRQLYAKYGVKEYWIADSENRSVEIYRLTDKGLELAAMLRLGDEITSPLLPGFSCPRSKIYET